MVNEALTQVREAAILAGLWAKISARGRDRENSVERLIYIFQ